MIFVKEEVIIGLVYSGRRLKPPKPVWSQPRLPIRKLSPREAASPDRRARLGGPSRAWGFPARLRRLPLPERRRGFAGIRGAPSGGPGSKFCGESSSEAGFHAFGPAAMLGNSGKILFKKEENA